MTSPVTFAPPPPTDQKKSLSDRMWPRSTLKTPHNCSSTSTFCCSSQRAPCDWPPLSEGAWLSRLEAELTECVIDSSQSSLAEKITEKTYTFFFLLN